MVPPPDVLNVVNSRPKHVETRCVDTNKRSKISLRTFELTKCAPQQVSHKLLSFVTVSVTELAKLDGPIACRESTLLGNEESTKAKGWMRENTRTGPVLEVTVGYHQGCHGIEIRNNSLRGDGSHSWGENKYWNEQVRDGNVGNRVIESRNCGWSKRKETCGEIETETNIIGSIIFWATIED